MLRAEEIKPIKIMDVLVTMCLHRLNRLRRLLPHVRQSKPSGIEGRFSRWRKDGRDDGKWCIGVLLSDDVHKADDKPGPKVRALRLPDP